MSVEEMRAQYEEIKASWHGADGRGRDEGIRRLTALAAEAESFPTPAPRPCRWRSRT